MRDDRVDAGLNATLDKGFVMFKILFAIFVPGLTTSGVEVITKLDCSAPGTTILYLQPLLAPAVKHHTTIKLAPLPKLIKVYYPGFKVP